MCILYLFTLGSRERHVEVHKADKKSADWLLVVQTSRTLVWTTRLQTPGLDLVQWPETCPSTVLCGEFPLHVAENGIHNSRFRGHSNQWVTLLMWGMLSGYLVQG